MKLSRREFSEADGRVDGAGWFRLEQLPQTGNASRFRSRRAPSGRFRANLSITRPRCRAAPAQCHWWSTTVDGRPIKTRRQSAAPGERRRDRCLCASRRARSLRSGALAAVRADRNKLRIARRFEKYLDELAPEAGGERRRRSGLSRSRKRIRRRGNVCGRTRESSSRECAGAFTIRS